MKLVNQNMLTKIHSMNLILLVADAMLSGLVEMISSSAGLCAASVSCLGLNFKFVTHKRYFLQFELNSIEYFTKTNFKLKRKVVSLVLCLMINYFFAETEDSRREKISKNLSKLQT